MSFDLISLKDIEPFSIAVPYLSPRGLTQDYEII